MLREALTFPTRGRRGPVSVLIGGVLVFLRWGLFGVGIVVVSVVASVEGTASVAATAAALVIVALPLVVVELALRGYRIRALRATVSDPTAAAPGFGRPGALFRDGLLGVGVTLGYALPGAVLLWVAALGVGAVPEMAPTPTSLSDAVARNLAGLALLFGLLELVGAAYLLPAASASAAHERSLRAAFGRRVLAGAFSEDYAVGWVTAGLLALVVYPAVVVASSLVVLPLVAAPFGSFFLAVAIRHLYGAGFGVATGLATRSPEADTTAVAADATDAEQSPPPAAPGDRDRHRAPDHDAESADGSASRPPADGTDEATGRPGDPMADEFRR